MSGKFFWLYVALFLIAVIAFGSIQLHDSIECANKGGVYVTAKGMWPACLAVKTL